MIDGQEFLSEFLAAGMACDTMKDGFATLVDSEGHPYVANLNEKEKSRYAETKKPLSQVKKEKKETEGKKPESEKKTEEKSETEQDLTKAEIKKKLKNLYERAKKELHKELRKKRERTTGEKLSDEEIEKSIKDYEKYDNLRYVSVNPIFYLMSDLNRAKEITPRLLKDIKDFLGKNKLNNAEKITPELLKDVKDFFDKNKLSMAQDSLDNFIDTVIIE